MTIVVSSTVRCLGGSIAAVLVLLSISQSSILQRNGWKNKGRSFMKIVFFFFLYRFLKYVKLVSCVKISTFLVPLVNVASMQA